MNGAAQVFPDFPMAATTPFQVANLYEDGKDILIVANGNSIFAYKLKQLPNNSYASEPSQPLK